MIANKGKVTFTIPECIPAGQYLLRHEMIGESLCRHSVRQNAHAAVAKPFMQHRATRALSYTYAPLLHFCDARLYCISSDGVRPAPNYRRRKHTTCHFQFPRRIPGCVQHLHQCETLLTQVPGTRHRPRHQDQYLPAPQQLHHSRYAVCRSRFCENTA